MKRVKSKIITTLLAVIMAFSLTACTSQADIDNAVNPVTEQITQIDGYIDTLESKVETLENSLATINTAIETLEENSATKTALLETKTALESEITAIKADIQALKDKDSAFASELSALDGRLTTLETSVATLNTAVTALQAQVEQNKQDIAGLENRVDELENVINCMASGTHVLDTYLDCGDGTHALSCEVCGYVDTATKENHLLYVGENCKCSVCGMEHYLPFADEGNCMCSYCLEYIHDLDENCVCTICSLPLHNTVNSTTGICSVCNTFGAAASITVDDVKTYYSTFDEAVAYANGKDGAVIVIENDCCRMDLYSKFTSGNITIDLNGKIIDSTSTYSISTYGATVTVCDSVGGGKTLKSVGGFSGTLIIEGGIYTDDTRSTNLIITGGEFARVTVTTGQTATISGGSFERIGVYNGMGTLADILADGYCFYDKNGNVVDISTIQTDEYGWYYLYNVTVGEIK